MKAECRIALQIHKFNNSVLWVCILILMSLKIYAFKMLVLKKKTTTTKPKQNKQTNKKKKRKKKKKKANLPSHSQNSIFSLITQIRAN